MTDKPTTPQALAHVADEIRQMADIVSSLAEHATYMESERLREAKAQIKRLNEDLTYYRQMRDLEAAGHERAMAKLRSDLTTKYERQIELERGQYERWIREGGVP